jgi:import inner membrane translocase subunit TIM17
VDDCGGAFALGAIGGTLFHSIKGFRHAPAVNFFIVMNEFVIVIF